MSPSPIDRAREVLAGSFRRSGLRARAARAWRRARHTPARHVVYLHGRGVTSLRAGARTGDVGEPVSGAGQASFERWCDENPGANVSLRVSGSLLHTLVVDPALQLRGEAALRRYAQQQFAHYYGARAERWPLAAWNRGTQGMVCGLHGIDLPSMLDNAERQEVRILDITPIWCAGLAAVSRLDPSFTEPGRRALLLAEGDAATWLVAQEGEVVSVQHRHADSAHGDDVLALLASLIADTPALAAPPLLIGHGLEQFSAPALTVARACGDLVGAGMLADLMRVDLGRPA